VAVIGRGRRLSRRKPQGGGAVQRTPREAVVARPTAVKIKLSAPPIRASSCHQEESAEHHREDDLPQDPVVRKHVEFKEAKIK
jgi:hypothetical protein